MRRLIGLTFVFPVACVFAAGTVCAEESPAAVAWLVSVEGDVEVHGPASAGQKGADRGLVLVAGTRLVVGPGGSSVLVLADGRELHLVESTEVVIEAEGFRTLEGEVSSVAKRPAVARLVPVLATKNGCVTPVREMGDDPGPLKLRPASRSAVPAGELVFNFEPPAGYDRFRVEITVEFDGVVFDLETAEHRVVVPAGVLDPASSFVWSVETLDAGRPRLFQAAGFSTLSEAVQEARTEVIELIEADQGDHLAMFLQAVDQALCLDRPYRTQPGGTLQ